MKGVCYIVYGANARREAEHSIKSLRQHNDLPVAVIGDRVRGANEWITFDDQNALGRWAKVNLYRLSPFDQTLYLDADTRVHGDLSSGYTILDGGCDLAICPSTKQGSDALWHVSEEERAETFRQCGRSLVLQAGVFFFRKSEGSCALFSSWREEWNRWMGQDQAALMRALIRAPTRLWLLAGEWNGGSIVSHRYGMAREGP